MWKRPISEGGDLSLWAGGLVNKYVHMLSLILHALLTTVQHVRIRTSQHRILVANSQRRIYGRLLRPGTILFAFAFIRLVVLNKYTIGQGGPGRVVHRVRSLAKGRVWQLGKERGNRPRRDSQRQHRRAPSESLEGSPAVDGKFEASGCGTLRFTVALQSRVASYHFVVQK